ncbi:hypothetical protein [Streptomyces lunaelactis]|uniref:hypothetical protein n=1 Tax=Streptomyces lunaelactis TaxID=1535768 RepID=UPI00131F1026|nr:hypothetical protein [Streptomyces lunaelactis]NUK87336.1 hypothetical protein [Streptomyces lunaelactis]
MRGAEAGQGLGPRAGPDRAGHLPSLERPDETTALLLGFLAENPPYPSPPYPSRRI